jgi:hypothetical protein
MNKVLEYCDVLSTFGVRGLMRQIKSSEIYTIVSETLHAESLGFVINHRLKQSERNKNLLEQKQRA